MHPRHQRGRHWSSKIMAILTAVVIWKESQSVCELAKTVVSFGVLNKKAVEYEEDAGREVLHLTPFT